MFKTLIFNGVKNNQRLSVRRCKRFLDLFNQTMVRIPIICPKNTSFFFILSKWSTIQYAIKLSIDRIEIVKTSMYFGKSFFFIWIQFLLIWKEKMTHNFWTEFDNSDHSEPEKEGRTKRRTQTQKKILSFCFLLLPWP